MAELKVPEHLLAFDPDDWPGLTTTEKLRQFYAARQATPWPWRLHVCREMLRQPNG